MSTGLIGVELNKSVDLWMTTNDPTRPQPMTAVAGELKGRPAVVQLAGVRPDGVASNATLIGSQLDSTLKLSRDLKALILAKKPDEGLTHFKNQPFDGCTSVMNMARIAAHFNPVDADDAGNVAKFQDYTARILKAPFFNLGYADSKKEQRTSEDWTELIDSIVDLFESASEGDRARIKSGLKKLSEAATSQSGSKQKQNLFVQNVLEVDGGRVNVYIYYTSVALVEDKKKGCTSKQTEFNVARAQLIFRTREWPDFAERVWNKHVAVVDDWLESNSTKPGDQPTALCI